MYAVYATYTYRHRDSKARSAAIPKLIGTFYTVTAMQRAVREAYNDSRVTDVIVEKKQKNFKSESEKSR